jgi:hypothetical protein
VTTEKRVELSPLTKPDQQEGADECGNFLILGNNGMIVFH